MWQLAKKVGEKAERKKVARIVVVGGFKGEDQTRGQETAGIEPKRFFELQSNDIVRSHAGYYVVFSLAPEDVAWPSGINLKILLLHSHTSSTSPRPQGTTRSHQDVYSSS